MRREGGERNERHFLGVEEREMLTVARKEIQGLTSITSSL